MGAIYSLERIDVGVHDLDQLVRRYNLRIGKRGGCQAWAPTGPITRAQVQSWLAAIPKALPLFDRLDTGGDGRCDVAELISILILSGYGSLADKATAVFQLYDYDGDSILSKSELVLLIRGTLRALAKSSASLRMPRLHQIEQIVKNILEADPHDPCESISIGRFSQWCSRSTVLQSLMDAIRGPEDETNVILNVVGEEQIGGRAQSLGRIQGRWVRQLSDGLNSCDNPQFLLRLKSRCRPSRCLQVSIIIERDLLASDSSSSWTESTPMYLYVFRSTSKTAGRLLDLSGADLVAATQGITTTSGQVRFKAPSGTYIIMACLQISNLTGTFHITVRSDPAFRSHLQELPFLITRIFKPCSDQHEGGLPIIVQIPPKQCARIDLVPHGTCNVALLRAEFARGAKLQLRSIERDNHRGRYLVENQEALPQELCLYPGSSSRTGSLEIRVISSHDISGRAKILLSPNSTIKGRLAIGKLPQILLRFIAPESGLEHIQFVFQSQNIKEIRNLNLCLFQVQHAIPQLNLAEEKPFARSRLVSNSDSVSLEVALATSKMYVLVLIVDAAEQAELGEFTLVCQSSHQEQVQIQLLPDLQHLEIAALCSPDRDSQFLMTSSTFVMVKIILISDASPPEHQPFWIRVYRSVNRIRTCRPRYLLGEDMLVESEKMSCTFLMEPLSTSAVVLVVSGPASAQLVISSSQAIKVSELYETQHPTAVVKVTPQLEIPFYDYESIVKTCERAELMFTDSQFIPSPEALGPSIRDQAQGWMHIIDLTDQPRLFDEVLDLHDIEVYQNTFCAFIQALAAIVVKLDLSLLIRRLFVTKQVSYWSIYCLRLYDHCQKQWCDVVIDDYVPVRGNWPCFVRYRDPDVLWLPLLVKGLAKLHRSYQNLSEQSDPGIFIENLTGSYPFVTSQFDLDVISNACDRAECSTIAIPKFPSQLNCENNRDIAIAWYNAYVICEVRQSKTSQLQLAVIRCVSGRYESYRGRWSQGSERWTSELKSELGYDEIGTDSFFVDLDELVMMFKCAMIVKLPKVEKGFKFMLSQEGVWHKSLLSGGIQSLDNPQWIFATKQASIAIRVSISFRERRRMGPISIVLFRVKGDFPVTELPDECVISRNELESTQFGRIEVTLPNSASGKPLMYGIIVGFGQPGQHLEAPFTLVVKSTEPIFLSRSQFVAHDLAVDVLRARREF